MNFSRHTLIMSLLLFTLLAIIGGFTTHKASWKTVKLSFFIILLGIIRFLFPVEFFGVTVIGDNGIYAIIDQWIRIKVFGTIQIAHLLMLIWLLGTIVYLTYFGFCLYKQWRFLQKCTIPKEHELYKVCSEFSLRVGFPFKGTIKMSPQFSVPGMIGLLKPNIVLPNDMENIPDEYIPYIFYHELYHFKGKDSWILLGLEILCSLLWWNPAVYFLKSGIEHVLELRCDRNVCTMIKSNEEKKLYTNALIFLAERQVPSRKILISGYTGKKQKIIYRFEEILKSNQLKSNVLKPCITFLFVLLSVMLFILSYQYILQPSFLPPSTEENLIEDEDSNHNTTSFILRLKDGSLMYFENGQYSANLTEELLKIEPYCNVPIYDRTD